MRGTFSNDWKEGSYNGQPRKEISSVCVRFWICSQQHWEQGNQLKGAEASVEARGNLNVEVCLTRGSFKSPMEVFMKKSSKSNFWLTKGLIEERINSIDEKINPPATKITASERGPETSTTSMRWKSPEARTAAAAASREDPKRLLHPWEGGQRRLVQRQRRQQLHWGSADFGFHDTS